MAIRSSALALPTPISTLAAPGGAGAPYDLLSSYYWLVSLFTLRRNLPEVIAPEPQPGPSPVLKSLLGIPLGQHPNGMN